MPTAQTLLLLAGADLTPAKADEACLVLIDMQNEYLAGPIAVSEAEFAVERTARLLARPPPRGSSPRGWAAGSPCLAPWGRTTMARRSCATWRRAGSTRGACYGWTTSRRVWP